MLILRKLFFGIVLLLATTSSFAQTIGLDKLRSMRTKSWHKVIYRVPADSVLAWQKAHGVNFKYLQTLAPFWFGPDSVYADVDFPIGHYVKVRSQFEHLTATTEIVSKLVPQVIDKNSRKLLLLYSTDGSVVQNAVVTLDGKKAIWQAESGGYLLPEKKVAHDDDKDLILVAATLGDTLLMNLNLDNNHYSNRPTRFEYWPIVKQVRLLGKKVSNALAGRANYPIKRRQKQRYSGFVVFNKPLYNEKDTLRFKAWLTNRKGKPIKAGQTVIVEYRKDGNDKVVNLGQVLAETPGSFFYSWPLPDSIPMDTRFSLGFQGPKPYNRFASNFSTEAYALPDISKFEIKAAADEMMYSDSMAIYLEAKDVNGLPLPDGKVTVFALAKQIEKFYTDKLFVADTLWQKEINLSADDSNMVWLPASYFPKADFDMKIVATLRNASNEVVQDETTLKHYYKQRRIAFTRNGERLLVQQLVDGKSETAKASIYQWSDWLDSDTLVHLPFELKLHDLAADVDVDVLSDAGKILIGATYNVNEKSNISLAPNCNADSIGFICSNPMQVPVWLSVTKGRELIWSGKTRQSSFSWQQKAPIKQFYRVQATYLEDEEERTVTQPIAILYSRLQVKAAVLPVVEPGAKDSLKITVTNYKGQPVANANLTATAQNTQLKNSFTYPNLPYYMRFKKQKTSSAPYETDLEVLELETKNIAKRHLPLSRLLGLDSMTYYKWLFSNSAVQVTKSKISAAYPEVSVYAIEDGKFVPIFITYLNNKPIAHAWCNALQDKATSTLPGFAKITVRTSKSEISVDSVYLQPHVKHNVFINLDSATQGSKLSILPKPDTLLSAEKALLATHFIEIEGNSDIAGSWIWSGLTQTRIPNGTDTWIAGPFEPGMPINVWKGNLLDFSFPFEPGYRYRLSQRLTRLEKLPFLPNAKTLRNSTIEPSYADTTVQQSMPPTMPTVSETRYTRLLTMKQQWETSPENGTLKLDIVTDTIISYTVLLPADSAQKPLIFDNKPQLLHNLPTGTYRVLLIDKANRGWLSAETNVMKNGLTCVRCTPALFEPKHASVMALFDAEAFRQSLRLGKTAEKPKATFQTIEPPIVDVKSGSTTLTGRITDAVSGDPLPAVSVMIKNSKTATITGEGGYYTIPNMAAGRYTLLAAYVGYQTKEVVVHAYQDGVFTQNLALQVSTMALDEVVVIGYSSVAKRSLTFSVASISTIDISQHLEGKVAGIQVSPSTNIRIRGSSSFQSDGSPLYVVDGVPMFELPAGLDASQFEMTVLKQNVATSLYGSRASNGVILISTGRTSGSTIRTKFRDYAYWEPQVLTNQQGEAIVPISYPDNLTSWQHMVYAAAPKGRYGSAFATTRAFKPLQGLLAVPAFVLQGDTVAIVGKAMNYGAEPQPVKTTFSFDSRLKEQAQNITANGFLADTLVLVAPPSPDTLRPKYVVMGKKGSQDGEARTIPVLPVGMQETTGQFFMLSGDTSVSFTVAKPELQIEWHAEANLLNLLENELEALRNYPQACMEQTANKMWGLLMQKQIKAATAQEFVYQKNVNQLQDRLVQHQLPNGAWSWWEAGNANIYITTKVLQALRVADTVLPVKQAIRNGYLFLQNQLPFLPVPQKLEALYCLSEGSHVYPYEVSLESMAFDSLTEHQQWQMVRIKQNVGLPYQVEISKLWDKRKETFTGALFWGEDNWYWYRNAQSTMVVACKVVAADSAKRGYLPQLHQYLLTAKKYNRYANTVEQAEIIAVLLKQNPRLWQNGNASPAQTGSAAKLYLNNVLVDKFPNKGVGSFGEKLELRKTGQGILFASVSQQWWNARPVAKDTFFRVMTSIDYQGVKLNGKALPVLKAGASFAINVTVEVKKQAEFVQINIPIPAGAVYNGKPNSGHQHREYLKDKVQIFIENLTIGKHEFSVPLQARFEGVFTVNPAEAQMMYFPVFSGNDGLKMLAIAGQ